VGEGDPRTLELLRELAVRPRTKAAREIHLRFLASPVEILGTERVERLVVAENELYEGSGGRLRARPSGRYETIPADLVLRAIGYRGVALPGVPFDEGRGVIPNAGGRMLDGPEGSPMPGEYVAGWIKRGPRGIIGTNKPDAQETVEALLADLAEGHLRDPYRPEPAAVDELLGRRKPDYVTYEDWQIIDELERARGAETGRARRKFARIEEMLDALAERKDAMEVADEALEVEAPEG
jgi:ferredoxin/flavodoxin---NADP+ reductase